MIEFLSSPGGNTMGVRLDGKVTADNFRQLDVRLRHLIDLWGQVGLVVVMGGDARFGIGARLGGMAMRFRRVGHVERLALLGPPQWEHRVHRRLPLRKASVRYFPADQLDDAWQWVGATVKRGAARPR